VFPSLTHPEILAGIGGGEISFAISIINTVHVNKFKQWQTARRNSEQLATQNNNKQTKRQRNGNKIINKLESAQNFCKNTGDNWNIVELISRIYQ